MPDQIKVIPADEITRRFDKIEDKLDVLSDAMITLARNEEKLEATQERMNTHSARLNRQSERLDALERIAQSNAFASKIVWLFLTAVVASVVSMKLGIM